MTRDSYGNVLGGIRFAQAEVATALNSRENSGAGLCDLYGAFVPFDAQILRKLYATHDSYVSRINQVSDDNLGNGFIVNADAQATKSKAQVASIPP